MKVSLRIVLILFVGIALASGCNKPEESDDTGGGDGAEVTTDDDGQEHSHGDDDALIWQRKDIEHEGYVISLGHHGEQLYADHEAEPAVMVEKDGEPVANAFVFVTLLDVSGENVITEEQGTTYEPPIPAEPAHYAQAEVMMPAGATEAMLRFRITLPEASEFSEDVVVPLITH